MQRLSTTFNNHDLGVAVNNKPIKKVRSIKSLGVNLDENLTWENHVNGISKKISSGIGALKRVRDLIDQLTAIKIYQGFIDPYFTYCAPVWDGMGSTLCEKL
jgi:hypothetical protein